VAGALGEETRDSARGDAGEDPLVIVANRGPVSYTRTEGERVAERGKGGLVTALAGLVGQFKDAVWVCAALSDEEDMSLKEEGRRDQD